MRMQSILRIRNALALVALGAVLVTANPPAFAQEAFETADQAVTALVNAVRSDNPEQAIVKVLGPDVREIASSGDEVDGSSGAQPIQLVRRRTFSGERVRRQSHTAHRHGCLIIQMSPQIPEKFYEIHAVDRVGLIFYAQNDPSV